MKLEDTCRRSGRAKKANTSESLCQGGEKATSRLEFVCSQHNSLPLLLHRCCAACVSTEDQVKATDIVTDQEIFLFNSTSVKIEG